MDEYCRFCAGKEKNLTNISKLDKGVCDWLIELLNQNLDTQQIKLNNTSRSICYCCLCTIEDINIFIQKCRISLLHLENISQVRNQTKENFLEIKSVKDKECDEFVKGNEYNSEYIEEFSDEKDELDMYIEEDNYITEYEVNEIQMLKKDDIKEFRCKDCLESFYTLKELAIHHKSHKKYLCPECGASFNLRSNFYYHMKKHMNTNYFVCNFCSKSFMTKYQLTSHMWTHTGSGFENHECEECGKKCRNLNELKIHRRFHSQFRPHKCDICSKAFVVKTHLKQHMVTHTGVRNFICSVAGCNKSYTATSSLKKHIDSHLSENEKHITCKYCPKKFSMEFILRDHVRKSHKKISV